MSFTVNQVVSVSRVHNAIVGAFEGGSNYWLHSAIPVSVEAHTTPNLVWYGEESVFTKPFSFEVEFDNPNNMEETATKILTQDDFTKGLNIMAEKWPNHFADLITENDDAATHDVMIQCVIFGDIIYG